MLALCPNPQEAELTAQQTRGEVADGSEDRGQTVFEEVNMAQRRFLHLRPARIGAMDWTLRHFKGIERQVMQLTKDSDQKVSAIFYACIYDFDFEWFSVVKPFLKMPWLGLYLHATSFRMPGLPNPGTGRLHNPAKMLGGRMCRGIGVLDEGIVAQASETIGTPVHALPDLTDERYDPDDKGQPIANRLKQAAAGRPVVGLFGHLQRSKGVLPFLEAAESADPSELCFALAGDMLWISYKDGSQRIHDLIASSENVWTHLSRIPDGQQMNALLMSCDVICASYLDFPNSSNIMTKAALLRKPIIVSEGYLMAERVKRHRMGEVVPQGDSQALLNAVLKITKNPSDCIEKNQPDWDAFIKEHSFEKLKTSMASLISPIKSIK